MNNKEFVALFGREPPNLTWPGAKSYHAARLVLVSGLSANAAAIKLGLHTSSVTRYIARRVSPAPAAPVCKCCGQKLPRGRA